ncbi:zinc-binding dehydrogenase [Streptomyces mayonensis]|uniref:zinc-binding dehydrogenase n=1 Tax=Streptomyces mayonensis TaxID=2750816 RepID=UPI0027E57D63|nr:zinc-binding dehydrogenase [Streptomyces sp. A108]
MPRAESARTVLPRWLGTEHHRASGRAGARPRRPGPLRRGGLRLHGRDHLQRRPQRRYADRGQGRRVRTGRAGAPRRAVRGEARLRDGCGRRGDDREELARELGARHYVDSTREAPGTALAALGGVDHVIRTASTTDALGELVTGLRPHGRLTLVGVGDGVLCLPVGLLVGQGVSVTGHLTGSARDTEEAMAFAVTNGVRPVIERMPLREAGAAVARLRSAAPRFRIVLDPSQVF